MKKLLSILLILFSIHAYSAPLYVKLESDGDLIFSNTPIIQTKPDALPKKRPVATVIKENINNSPKPKINTKPMMTDPTEENENYIPHSNVIPISLPNNIPIIDAITEENTRVTHKSDTNIKPTALPKNMPMIIEATKENVNNTHSSHVKSISLPNNIPIIAAVTEKNLRVTHKSDTHPKLATPVKNKPVFAEATRENINKTHTPEVRAKAIIQPKNKFFIIDSTEENVNKTQKSIKTKTTIFPKNKTMIAKATKDNLDKTHQSTIHTKLISQSKNKSVVAVVTRENINKTHKPNTIAKPAAVAKNKPLVATVKKETINTSDMMNTKLTYKTFKIISPLNKEVLQNLEVDLKIEPKLQPDHKILLFIDGKRMNKPSSSTHINTDAIKKGSHEIYGLIIDKNKNFVTQSNVITIYIRQTQVNKPDITQAVRHKVASLNKPQSGKHRLRTITKNSVYAKRK